MLQTALKIIALLWGAVQFFLPASVMAGGVPDYPAQRITGSIYVIQGPMGYPSVENHGFMNNPAFIVTQAGVVVVDPGSSLQAGEMVLRQIRRVTRKPVTHVFVTHVHGDHWLGNQAIRNAYPKAMIIAHPDMIRLAREGVGQRWVDFMLRATEGITRGTRAEYPTVGMTDGAEVKTGGKTFRVHAVEDAHSHSDLMIEVVEDRVFFGGDNLLYKRIARLDDATFAGNIKALDRALQVNARYYVPGHGPVGDVAIVHAYRNYLTMLYTEVARHYEAGQNDFEMKPTIVRTLSDYQDWVNFEDEVGKHISLAILEVEQNL